MTIDAACQCGDKTCGTDLPVGPGRPEARIGRHRVTRHEMSVIGADKPIPEACRPAETGAAPGALTPLPRSMKTLLRMEATR